MFYSSHASTKNAGRRVVCCRARALTAPTPTAATVIKKEPHGFPTAPVRASTAHTSSVLGEFLAAKTTASSTPAAPLDKSVTRSAAAVADVVVKDATTGDSSNGLDASRASMSRRGLSVHAAPFKPRHLTDTKALSSTIEVFDSMDFRSIQDERQQRLATGSSSVFSQRATYHQLTPQGGGVWSTGLEFPLTPAAAEGVQVRLASPPTDSAGRVATVVTTSSVDLRGGDPLNYSAPLLPVFLNTAKHRQQQQQWASLYSSYNCGGSSNERDTHLPDDNGDNASDNIRHRRVAFTDAEAMDEDVMLDMLRCSSSSDDVDDCNEDDEDDTVYMDHYQQQYMFDLAQAHSTDLDVYSCAGGYWDLRGPHAATRRFLHRGGNSSTASLTLTALSDRASPIFVSGGGVVADRGGGGGEFYDEVNDDFWEMNSSAYTDSLDEVQVEWIEQQLHAKENPDGFFP